MPDFDRAAIAPPPAASALFRLMAGVRALARRALARLRREPRARLVQKTAAELEQSGALVFADAEGWPRPPNIHGFVPCVYAVYEDGEVVLRLTDPEVKHTEERRSHQAFAAWAEESPEREYEPLPLKGHRRAPPPGSCAP
jgi:hypothetical protein